MNACFNIFVANKNVKGFVFNLMHLLTQANQLPLKVSYVAKQNTFLTFIKLQLFCKGITGHLENIVNKRHHKDHTADRSGIELRRNS